MSVVEALRDTVARTTVEYSGETIGISVEENSFFKFEYLSKCTDRSLNEIGEKCRRAFFAHGIHVLICTLRICLVSSTGTFYFPPLDLPILDALLVPLEASNFLMCCVVSSGLYWFVVELLEHPVVLRRAFYPMTQSPERVHAVSQQNVVVCHKSGSFSVVSVALSAGNEIQCSETTQKEKWIQKVSALWSSNEYVDSFLDASTGFFVVLSSGFLELWRLNRDGIKKCDSVQSPKGSRCVVPSTRREFMAYVLTEDCQIIPFSRRQKQKGGGEGLMMGANILLPKLFTLKRVTCAASHSSAGLVLYDHAARSVAVVCEKCQNFNAKQLEDTITILNLDVGVSAICPTSMEGEEGTPGFILYHEDGSVSYLKRFSNGEVLCRLNAQGYSSFAVLLLPSSVSTVVSMLDGLYRGLPFATVKNVWEEIMTPSMKLSLTHTGNLEHCTWRLSTGALGCAQFLSHQLQSTFLQFTSVAYQAAAADAARQRLLDVYHQIRSLLDEGGWLACGDDYVPGTTHWNGDEMNSPMTSSSVRDAVNFQAEYLTALLQLVFRSLGYVSVYRLCRTYLDNFPKDPMEETATGAVSYTERLWNWLNFISSSTAQQWQTDRLLTLLTQLVSSRPTGETSPLHSLLPLASQLTETTFFLSDECKLLINLHLLVHEERYEEAMTFAEQHLAALVAAGWWTTVTRLLETHCPSMLPTVQLILSRLYALSAAPSAGAVEAVQEYLDELLVVLDLLPVQSLHAGLQRVVTPPPSLTPVQEHVYQTQLLPVVIEWIEHWPLLRDDRVPVFERFVIETSAVWRLYQIECMGGRFPRDNTNPPLCEERTSQATAVRYAPPDGRTALRVSSYYYCFVLSGAQGRRMEAARGFYEMALSDDRSVTVAMRLRFVSKALELLAPSPQKYQGLRDEMELAEYHLLLQDTLRRRLEKYHTAVQEQERRLRWSHTEHMKSNEEEPEGLASPPVLLYPPEQMQQDLLRLQETFVSGPDLVHLGKQYRALGGASVELDVLKLDPHTDEQRIAEALRHLLAYLHGVEVNAVKPRAEEVVRRVLMEKSFLPNFVAPFPLDPIVEFLWWEQERTAARGPSTTAEAGREDAAAVASRSSSPAGELDFLQVVTLLLQCPLHPLFLFQYVLRLLVEQWQSPYKMEAEPSEEEEEGEDSEEESAMPIVKRVVSPSIRRRLSSSTGWWKKRLRREALLHVAETVLLPQLEENSREAAEEQLDEIRRVLAEEDVTSSIYRT